MQSIYVSSSSAKLLTRQHMIVVFVKAKSGQLTTLPLLTLLSGANLLLAMSSSHVRTATAALSLCFSSSVRKWSREIWMRNLLISGL